MVTIVALVSFVSLAQVRAADVGFSPSNSPQVNSDLMAAFQAALPLATGETLQFPAGAFRFARQIDLVRPICIKGVAGGPHTATTNFRFPVDSHGFYAHSHMTYYGYNSIERAQGACVEDVRVSAEGKGAVRHAFVVKNPIRIERVYIENFSGDGIHLNTGMPMSSASLTKAVDTVIANGGVANTVVSIERTSGVVTVTTAQPHHFELDTIFWLHKPGQTDPFVSVGEFPTGQKGTIIQVVSSTVFKYSEAGADAGLFAPGLDVRTGHGIYTHGGDSNGCSFTGIYVSGMKGFGVFEDSFLGNTYTRCMTDENQMGAYAAGLYQANAANEFISCYSEQNQPYSYFGAPTVVIGGTHGATVLGRGTFVGAGRTDEVVASVKDTSDRRVGSVQIGGSKGYPSFLKVSHESDIFPSELVFGHGTAQLGGWGGNWLAWKYQGGSQAGFMLSFKGATAPPSGSRAVDVARIAFPTGFYGARGRLETEHYAPPTGGQDGDRVWNSGPEHGECLLWVKVSGSWRCAIQVPVAP